MKEAQVYFYQERTERKPDGKLPRVVGAELVLDDVLLATATKELDGFGMVATGEAVNLLGQEISKQAGARTIQTYKVLLYQRYNGECIKEDEFYDPVHGEKRTERRTFSVGNDAVGHTQTFFVRGLSLGDETKFRELWGRLYPKKK
jgi:hypothetical protein